MTVPARLHIVTLAVTDIPTAVAFYQALGWPLASSSGDEVAWFDLGGCWLGLHPCDMLADDAATPAIKGFEATLAICVESPEAVDAAMAVAEKAGAEIARPAERVEWGGYRGYFADPDGHRWELAHNPYFPIEPDGRLVIP